MLIRKCMNIFVSALVLNISHASSIMVQCFSLSISVCCSLLGPVGSVVLRGLRASIVVF